MRSLRSSSALVCNFFELWRTKALGPLTAALGLHGEFVEFHYEQKYPHGLRSTPPNIDIVFFPRAGLPVGVESKFAESYDSPKPERIKAKYFGGKKRWAELGLPRCQSLAEALGNELQFERLGAAQLLKHILGLARVHSPEKPIHLLYLWFDDGGEEADVHRKSADRFQAELDSSVDFKIQTYQTAFSALTEQPDCEPRPGYFEDLRQRYFAI